MSKLGFISGLTVVCCAVACAGKPPASELSEPREDEPGESDGFQPPDVPAEAPPPPEPPKRLALVTAETPPPPIGGGTLAVSHDGTLAVAADPDRDRVYVVQFAASSADAGANDKFKPALFDASVQPQPEVAVRESTVSTVALAAGSEPGRVVLQGSDYAHVALRNRRAVVRISLANAKVEQETEVCALPRGLSYDATRDAIWVACADGELVSLAASTHEELSRSFIALDLRDVVVTPDGERFVSRYRSAELLHVDIDGKVVATTRPKLSWSFNEQQESLTKNPALAWRTLVSPEGKVFMLHQQAQNEPVNVQPGGYGGLCGGSITQPGITEFDEHGAPALTGGIPGSLAVDLAVAPGGESLAIALPGNFLRGSGTLQVLPKSVVQSTASASEMVEAADAPRAGTTPSNDAGLPPKPVKPAGCRVPGMVPTEEAQVVALAYDENSRLYALSREPAELLVYEPRLNGAPPLLAQSVPLDARSVRDTGHELFHADVGGGLACASCHGEALDDGHVWTFAGFGPRRTQNMRGGISATLPLHWEGDMTTFQHLVDEVMTGRMSGFRVEPEYADALASWIDQQPELKLEARDAGAATRGRALFESEEVGCAKCHGGDKLTNNETVDVGTGGKFQVPSLLGLGLRAPFMHDGCAKTLKQRFERKCGGGDKHGKTSQLTPEQIEQLVAYLESL